MIRRLALPIAAALIAAAGLVLLPGHPADAGALSPAWGDVDCSGGINPVDSLKLLKVDAGLTVSQPVPRCPAMGVDYAVGAYTWKWGDVDCSGTISPVDSLKELKVDAGFPVVQTVAGCPALGAPPGVTLDGDVVSSISGEYLTVDHASGDDMIAASSDWSGYFANLGTQSGGVQASMSYPGPDSTLDFRTMAFKAPGADWAGHLADFIAGYQASPGYASFVSQVTLGGKSVWKVSLPSLQGTTAYYYAAGDTLYVISTGDESLAGEAFGALPSSNEADVPAALPAGSDKPLPGSSPLMVQPMQQITPPVCVAEPFGRIKLDMMAIDTYYLIPVLSTFAPNGILLGELTPYSGAGPMVTFLYKADELGNMEQITMQAVAVGSGSGTGIVNFRIQHCLNGTWQDNQRVLTISQSFDQVTANITSGTLCDEEGGVAFSGSLPDGTDHFSGSDLKVCNPKDCVQAGLEPVSTTVDYSAVVALDGNSISLTWESEDTDLVHDGQGNLTACTHNGGTTEHTFSIDRLTFGPDLPY
jgi:hypothetical protein